MEYVEGKTLAISAIFWKKYVDDTFTALELLQASMMAENCDTTPVDAMSDLTRMLSWSTGLAVSVLNSSLVLLRTLQPIWPVYVTSTTDQTTSAT